MDSSGPNSTNSLGNNAERLKMGQQGWRENEEMRKEKNTERNPGMKGDHRDEEERSQNCETENEPPHELRLH